MSALTEARQRLIQRQRGMADEPTPDVATARARLRRAAHAVDTEFSPANLLRHELDHPPYLTIAAAVGAGAATGVLSGRVKRLSTTILLSRFLPLVSRTAIAWILRQGLR